MIKTRTQLIEKFVEFFESKGHKKIPSASLIPENDPTVLFTTAGMHPLVPFLTGQKHPLGKRIVNVQKCIRTGDIEEVGDEVHHTFFEMLGNWSFGFPPSNAPTAHPDERAYFKKESIEFSFEFLTSKKWLGIPIEKLAVSCFEGDKDAPKDLESAGVWKSLGVSEKRIAFLPKKNNWWGPAGETGPCGPDTEIFYWTGEGKAPEKFDANDKRWVEIWNNVFMQYKKDKRLILVGGMECLYDENFKINEELLETLHKFNTHYILVVNGFREKGYSLVKEGAFGTNWQRFSLEENAIKKDNPKYFQVLLERFNLVPEEVMYFDHNKKNVETAQKSGILSTHYTDLKSIKKFVEENIWAFFSSKQKNVDTGMGVERTLAVLNGLSDNYLTDSFAPIIEKIEEISGRNYKGNKKEMRIIADHLRAATFVLGDERGVKPSNVGQGYVLRRLIRRAVRYGKQIGISEKFCEEIAKVVIENYSEFYSELERNKKFILDEIRIEEEKFGRTLERGLRKLDEIVKNGLKIVSARDAFLLFQSYGFPIEMTLEIANEKRIEVDVSGFEEEYKKHQELSRTTSAGSFKSGLADDSERTTRLHTATHLLNEALRRVLGDEVKQKGSNITPERLRFDFNFSRKLLAEEIEKVENLVNWKIKQGLKVVREEMGLKEAMGAGAQAEFGMKYPDVVSVYTIFDESEKKGWFSREICTGPHVKNTKEVGNFKILKEESSSDGVRRIKATVD